MSEFSDHDPNTSDTRTPEERHRDYERALRENTADVVARAEAEARPPVERDGPSLTRDESLPDTADVEHERYGDLDKLAAEYVDDPHPDE